MRPPLCRALSDRPVLGTFFQTPITVLVLQQREVMVPWACWEPHTGPGRKIRSTRGCDAGLSEESHATAPLHYPP